MNTCHPLWQTTDTPSAPITRPANTPLRGSPRPAAILGVLTVLGMGTLAFTGQLSLLTGQVQQTIEVSLDDTGLDPVNIVATPGQTISWTNDGTTTRSLEVLSMEGTVTLATLTVSPDEVGSVTIPSALAYGVYPYRVNGTPVFTGQITIMEDRGRSSEQRSTSADASSTSASIIGSTTAANSTASPTPVGFEVNPYALTAGQIASAQTASVASDVANEMPYGGAPLRQGTSTYAPPPRTAQSGPAAWFVAGGSVAACAFLLRRQMQRLEQY